MSVSSLRLFCEQVGLKGQKKVNKFDIYNAIVEVKDSGSWKEWAKEAEAKKNLKLEKVKSPNYIGT